MARTINYNAFIGEVDDLEELEEVLLEKDGSVKLPKVQKIGKKKWIDDGTRTKEIHKKTKKIVRKSEKE